MSDPNSGADVQPTMDLNQQAPADSQAAAMGPPDPANGPFPGGVPTKDVDLPITIVFMLFFMLGLYVHLSIFRRNSSRGHKFLISDIIMDFCAIRTVTCIFRITWSIVSTRGVILVALITQNGGASLLFAVNIFFAQRLVRSIHPKAGWWTPFGQLTVFLLLSVPAMILYSATNLIISFFSAGDIDRLDTVDNLLKIGSGWNMFLAVYPVILMATALSIPGPKPERFGMGSQRVKVALLLFGSFLLMTGQAIRLYTVFNKEVPGTESVVYGKPVFYTTGFMLEFLVVAAYALGRVDLRFHVPNGSSGPGDYCGDKERGNYSVEDIERLIKSLEVPHHIMREGKEAEDPEMVFTIFFASKKDRGTDIDDNDDSTGNSDAVSDQQPKPPLKEVPLPKRPMRVTRRQTIIDAFKQQPSTLRRQDTTVSEIENMYTQRGIGLPPRPKPPPLYSESPRNQGYDPGGNANVWQSNVASRSQGNEKEVMEEDYRS